MASLAREALLGFAVGQRVIMMFAGPFRRRPDSVPGNLWLNRPGFLGVRH